MQPQGQAVNRYIYHSTVLLLILTGFLDLQYRIEFTYRVTFAAFYALTLINFVGRTLFSADTVNRTASGAQTTADTLLGINLETHQLLTLPGGTFFVFDVGLVFIDKILDGLQGRVQEPSAPVRRGMPASWRPRLFPAFQGPPSRPVPWLSLSRMSYMVLPPTRQGAHFPQDSSTQKPR